MEKGESIKKYIDRFWDLHLKACVFEYIGFGATKSQYCAGLPEDMQTYINAQKPKMIFAVIHHSMLAYKIFTTKEEKKSVEKVAKALEKPSNGKKVADPKKKDKGPYKGPNKLSVEQLESYCKAISVSDAVKWGTPTISVQPRRIRRVLKHPQ